MSPRVRGRLGTGLPITATHHEEPTLSFLMPMLSVAHAAGGHDAHPDESLTTVLFLLAVVGGAYLLTHFVVERLQQRLLFRSGLEYVVLGVVLGPTVLVQVHPFSDLNALAPLFAFVAGWVGLLYGLELRPMDFESSGRPLRLALTDAVVTGGIMTLASAAFLQSGLAMPPPSFNDTWLCAGVLGCASAAGSSSAVDLLANRYRDAQTHLLPMLRRTARLSDAVAIIAFGVLLAFFHMSPNGFDTSASDWILGTALLGLSLGLLFFFFIGNDEGENNVFLAMVGILMFASGAAFFLEISALTVNLVLGAVLAQAPTLGARISKQLLRTERPVSLMLLLFAGALWVPVDPLPTVVLTLGFIGLRLLCKVVHRCSSPRSARPLRGDLFRGMLAQGDAAVAMAVSMQLFYEGPVGRHRVHRHPGQCASDSTSWCRRASSADCSWTPASSDRTSRGPREPDVYIVVIGLGQVGRHVVRTLEWEKPRRRRRGRGP